MRKRDPLLIEPKTVPDKKVKLMWRHMTLEEIAQLLTRIHNSGLAVSADLIVEFNNSDFVVELLD